MLLMVAATRTELEPFCASGKERPKCLTLLSGVGPVEASYSLTVLLAHLPSLPHVVVNFGLAGAYPSCGLELLDLCLAEEEVFGDFGIVYQDRVEAMSSSFAPASEFVCDPPLLASAAKALTLAGMPFRTGRFATVAGVSGTTLRAESLRDSCRAICENMEGAALARVCQGFGIPFLEFRCISNMAVNRAEQVWHINGAARRCSQAAAIIAEGLSIEF